MMLRVPDYYKKFRCLADRCLDSCCVGWEIDVDEETYAYYHSLEGEFGDRLRENMAEAEERSFVLKEGRRCPFLNRKNLCDICLTLGEAALCEVCTEYPRFTLEYGNVREKCLALSCEEAGRLIFDRQESVVLEEMEIPLDFEEEEDVSQETICFFEWARGRALQILRDRRYSIRERASVFLRFAEKVQEEWNLRVAERNRQLFEEQWEGCDSLEVLLADDCGKTQSVNGKDVSALILERYEVYEKLEILDGEWESEFQRMKQALGIFQREEAKSAREGREQNQRKSEGAFPMRFYQEKLKEFQIWYQCREQEYEHLFVYFAFRYLMKAVYDSDFLGYAKFAAVSFLMIRDMDAVRFFDRGGSFTMKDRIDTARIYSKEVEHSEENLQLLLEEFMFRDAFRIEELIMQINL